MDLPSFLPFLFSVCWPSSFFKAFLSKISPLCLVCSFFSSCLSPHFPFPPPALRHLQVPPSSFLSFSSSSLVVFLVASSFPLRSSFIPSSAASHSISPTPPGLHYDGHLHRALPSQADFPSESTSPHPSLDGNTHSFPSVSSTSSGSSPHVPSTSDLPPSAVLQILLPHQRSRAYSLHSPWWLGAGSRWWFACPSQVSDCCQFFSALNREGARETRHARKEKETGAGGVGCSPGFCSQRKGSEEEEDKKKDAESVEGEWPSKEGDEQDLKGRREVVKKGYEKEEQADEACTGARRQKLSGGLLLSWSSHLPHKTAEVLLEEERKRCFLLLEGEKGEDGKAQRETRDSPSSLFPTCDEGGGDRGQIFWDRMRYKELQRAAYLNEEFPPVVEVMLCVLLLFLLPFVFNKTTSYFCVLLYENKACLVKEREGERRRETTTQELESQGKRLRLEKMFSWPVFSSLPLPSSLWRFVSSICEFSFEFLFLVLPLLLAYCLPEMLLPVTTGVTSLAAVFSFFSSSSLSSASSWNGLAPQKRSGQQLRPFQRPVSVSTLDVDSRGCIAVLTEFRGMLTIATCIAILGVDFFIFPRSLAKTCIFGLSLMDLGVGCFVFGSGVVSPEARRFQRTCFSSALKDTSSRRQGKRDSSVEKGSVLSRRKETLNAATHAADGMQRDNAVEQKRREEGEDDQEVLSIEKRNRDDCCYSQHSDDTTHPRTFDLAWLWTLLLSFLFCNSGRKTTETNENKKKRERTQRGGNVFWRAVGRSGVLGVLGFFRFLLLLLCDYHTPETEYGLHWNFYLTLMVVFLAAEGFHSATKRSSLGPSSYVLWGLGVAVGYQAFIWLADVDGNWVFTAPRDSFFNANREGILGCVGFFSLYLMGVGVGAFLASSSPPLHSTGTRRSLQGDEMERDTRRDKENEKAGEHSLRDGREDSQAPSSSSCSLFFQTSYGIFSVLFGGSVVFFLSYLLLSLGLGMYPTRRLNNLPWIILVASLNFFAISGLVFGEICLGDSKRVYISRMLEGISFNQIVIFLLANLLSGLVGIFMKTLLLPPIVALGILLLYSLLWSSIGFLLGQARTIIKLSF